MTIEKTFEWLFKRFQQTQLKTCPFDLECLKFLAEWVNREKEQNLSNQLLFAKLYCHVFIQEINFYKDFEFAQKSMNDILEKPITYHYQIFNQRLNDYEFNKFLTAAGIDIEKQNFIDPNKDNEKLKSLDNDDFIKFTKGVWSSDQTMKSLNNQITESINRFKNLE